jgi:uncharacterized delta-60 repeat protein
MTLKTILKIFATVLTLAFEPAWSAGGLDTTFGTLGQVIFGADLAGTVSLMQIDGKIVVAGNTVTAPPGNRNLVVIRLLASGAQDPSFGTGGRVQIDAVIGAGSSPAIHAIALEPDGRILISACTPAREPSAGCVGALFRLNGDGSRDDTFGDNGMLYDPSGSGALLEALVIQADGRIVGVGSGASPSSPDTGTDLLILRLTPTGAPDKSFGTAGTDRVHWMQGDDNAVDVSLQSDGRILVAANVGDARVNSYDQRTRMAVLRLLQDGTVDSGFADAGWWVYLSSRYGAATHRIQVLPDDQILVAGASEADSMDDETYSFVIRLSASGILTATYAQPTGAQMLDSVWQLSGPTPLQALGDGSVWISSGGTEALLIGTLREDSTSVGSGPLFSARAMDAGSLSSGDLNFLTATNIFAASQNRLVISGTSTDNVTGQSVAFITRYRPDDPAAGTISIDETYTQTETAVNLLVHRTGGSQGSVSVHFQTIDGEARAGQDYIAATGQLEWNDGDASDRQLSLSVLSQAHEAINPLIFYVRLAPIMGDIALANSAVAVGINTSPAAAGGGTAQAGNGGSTAPAGSGGGATSFFDLSLLFAAFCLTRVTLRRASSRGVESPPVRLVSGPQNRRQFFQWRRG